MKIAITGHTKGIGKCLFDELVRRGHTVSGYSRSNGFDISNKENCEQILQEITEFDVLINNAFDYFGQTFMLESLVELWDGQQKVIININSKSVFSKKIPESMFRYIEEKRKQLDLSKERMLDANPQLINVILGLVDTDMSKNFKARKLCPKDVAVLISDIIELKNKIYVQEIILDVPFQDWSDIGPV